MSVKDRLNRVEQMWLLTSTEGRERLLTELKAKSAHLQTESHDEWLSFEDDYYALPESLQGHLLIISTPEGWDLNKFDTFTDKMRELRSRERRL